MNVQHINDASPYTDGREHRIELRGFFSPQSIDEQLANYRIVMARINYLYLNFVKTDSLPPFNPPPIPAHLQSGDLSRFKTHGLIHFTPAEAAKVYIQFLEEAGLNPAEYAPYLRDTIVRRAVENRLKCHGGKSRNGERMKKGSSAVAWNRSMTLNRDLLSVRHRLYKFFMVYAYYGEYMI
jgi:hypothetical protein